MRKWIVAALLTICASTAAMANQTIATVQLPCKSGSQELSPTGSQLVVQCKDASLYLVDVPHGTAQNIVPAKSGQNFFAYSPDGQWVAVGFNDGSVSVFSSQAKVPAKHWTADSHRIDLLYFFPDSRSLFVGPVDSPGTVWDVVSTPTQVATLPVDFGGIDACAVSPDGRLLVAAGDDTMIRWYDTATWKLTRQNRDFLLETFALAFTLDGKELLAGGADGRLTIFDAASGKQLRQTQPEAGSSVFMLSVLGPPRVVTVYFDNAGGKPPHLLLWDIATATSTSLKFDSMPTCGGAVGNKLWACTTEGKTLTISQRE
jgi:WD40 repeat protein